MSVTGRSDGYRTDDINHENAESTVHGDSMPTTGGTAGLLSACGPDSSGCGRAPVRRQLRHDVARLPPAGVDNAASEIPDLDPRLHPALAYFAIALAYARPGGRDPRRRVHGALGPRPEEPDAGDPGAAPPPSARHARLAHPLGGAPATSSIRAGDVDAEPPRAAQPDGLHGRAQPPTEPVPARARTSHPTCSTSTSTRAVASSPARGGSAGTPPTSSTMRRRERCGIHATPSCTPTPTARSTSTSSTTTRSTGRATTASSPSWPGSIAEAAPHGADFAPWGDVVYIACGMFQPSIRVAGSRRRRRDDRRHLVGGRRSGRTTRCRRPSSSPGTLATCSCAVTNEADGQPLRPCPLVAPQQARRLAGRRLPRHRLRWRADHRADVVPRPPADLQDQLDVGAVRLRRGLLAADQGVDLGRLPLDHRSHPVRERRVLLLGLRPGRHLRLHRRDTRRYISEQLRPAFEEILGLRERLRVVGRSPAVGRRAVDQGRRGHRRR